MNSAYIGKLMELAQRDSKVIHILADSGTGFDEIFARNFPQQMYNLGIAEENMVGVAAGMATSGQIPFVFTAGAFLAYRAMEFIRDDVCFQNLNVKIVGMGSGLSWSSLGPTHHTTEDVSVLRAIPNLMILSPATPAQVTGCTECAYQHNGPVYLKIGMNHEKEFFSDDYMLPESGMDIIKGEWTGKDADECDVVLFCTGSILEEAIETAKLLSEKNICTLIVNVVRLKPFDGTTARKLAKGAKLAVVIEEHNIHGGLGSILAESFAYLSSDDQTELPSILPIGMRDIFAEGYGTHKMVREANNLDAAHIYKKIKGTLGK